PTAHGIGGWLHSLYLCGRLFLWTVSPGDPRFGCACGAPQQPAREWASLRRVSSSCLSLHLKPAPCSDDSLCQPSGYPGGGDPRSLSPQRKSLQRAVPPAGGDWVLGHGQHCGVSTQTNFPCSLHGRSYWHLPMVGRPVVLLDAICEGRYASSGCLATGASAPRCDHRC